MESLLKQTASLAIEAGHVIMEYYHSTAKINYKSDASPVTEADISANQLIEKALQELTPDWPVISEEGKTAFGEGNHSRFWLVDPLDGTKGFIKRRGEFSVNIALIEGNVPILGVIHVPVDGTTYLGIPGNGAWKIDADGELNMLSTASLSREQAQRDGVNLLISSHHSTKEKDAISRHYPVAEVKSAASALKFCLLAEGIGHLYPRFGPTMEWDTAAGQAIVEGAGGAVRNLDGSPFVYGKPGFLNPGFVAYPTSALEFFVSIEG